MFSMTFKNWTNYLYSDDHLNTEAIISQTHFIHSNAVRIWHEVRLQMVCISNGIWNLKAQPFEIWKNGCHFVKNYLKSGQKHPDFKWSHFQMVRTIAIAWPLEDWTIRNPICKKSGFQKFTDFEGSDFSFPLS